MYQFDEKSAITKVLKKQKKIFNLEMRKLRGKNSGLGKAQVDGANYTACDTFFVNGEYWGCERVTYDKLTGEKKNAHFFFITNKGEFVRFWKESDMIDVNGPCQEVYTILGPEGKISTEIRVIADGDKIVSIKEEDKELYRRLNIARRGTLANLHVLQERGDKNAEL